MLAENRSLASGLQIEEVAETVLDKKFDGIIWTYYGLFDPHKYSGDSFNDELRTNLVKHLGYLPKSIAKPHQKGSGFETYARGSLVNILGLVREHGLPQALVITSLYHNTGRYRYNLDGLSPEETEEYLQHMSGQDHENQLLLEAYKELADRLGIDFKYIPKEDLFPRKLQTSKDK